MSDDNNQPAEGSGSKSGSGPSRAGGFYPGGGKGPGAGKGKRPGGGSGPSGGKRRGNRPAGDRPDSAGGDASRSRQHQGGNRRGQGGDRRHGGTPPIEIAVRSSRNAMKRHAESLRDEQSRLACRGVLTAFIGSCKGSSSPGEVLGVVEQVVHVLEAGRRDDSQLPLALRSVTNFALEVPRRHRDVAEMLRLLLRHSYVLAADHIPRNLRDDGGFRATSILQAFEEIGAMYLDDAGFLRLSKG